MSKELTGAQKAAILLRAIGEEAAATVMKALDPKDIRKLGAFMKETANITKQEEEIVIAEFEQASSSGEVQFEGREFMESILKKALGPEKAARMLDSLNTKTYPGIDALKWVDPRTVAQLLKIDFQCPFQKINAIGGCQLHIDDEHGNRARAEQRQCFVRGASGENGMAGGTQHFRQEQAD